MRIGWMALCCLGGLLVIGPLHAQEYSYQVPDLEVKFNPDSGAGTFELKVSIVEDDSTDEYPSDSQGFSIGIACDSTYLVPESIELYGDILDINDGDGPEIALLGISSDESGFTGGVVHDLQLEETLVLEGVVLNLTFTLNEDNLIDATETIETDVSFSEELIASPLDPDDPVGEDPTPVSNLVVVDEEAVEPVLDDAIVTLVPDEDLESPPVFLRGDASGNGAVSGLTDALYLLNWAFGDGEDPPCMDAADANGNNAVSALTDALYLLSWAFSGGDDPPAPGPDECGVDPADEDDPLDCETGLDDC